MSGYFSNATTLSTNSLNHIGEKKYKIWGKPSNKIVLVMLAFLILAFYSVGAVATDPLLAYTDQIIDETKALKTKTLASEIPNSHIKKLRNHLKDVINHLQNGRKKLKKGKNKQAKKQFRKSRRSVRRYIRTLKRKVKNERIDSAVAAPLKADAKILKKHITQLIHGHTGNIQPIANAGLDQAAQIGQAVMLDGSASSDADGDSLQFHWLIIEQPSNSNAGLTNPDSVTPEFTPLASGLYRIELVVSDAQSSSLADIVSINVESTNTAPVADAGANQTGHVGDNITLDASASSDAEGDNLAYFWTLVTLPTGSNAALNSNDSMMPNFTADLPGLYQAELIVNDANLDSVTDYVDIQIDSLNTPPVANSGPDQSVFIGQLVTLDGSASSDVDGDLLTWYWSISTKPTGSTAQLDDDGIVQPTFTPDLEGQYVLQLIVDDDEDSSQADSVIINALKPNTLPIADAGLDQSGYVGDVISLDAGASWDADNDNLSFDWSLLAIPVGSGASLDDPNITDPSFVIDQPGDYVAQLMVNDGLANGVPDEVVITTLNSRPVANAGSDQNLVLGETIQLDASASSDADGDALTYQWSISSMPDGSIASLSSGNNVNPNFTPDIIGFYVFQLIVNDGSLDSEPVTVTLQVNSVEALSVTLTEPTDNLFTNQAEINFRGRLNHEAAITINNESVAIENDLTFTHLVSLNEGINTFALEAIDIANGQVQTIRQVTLDTIVPVIPQLNLITVSQPDNNGITTISGAAGSVEVNSEVVIRNNDTNAEVSIFADDQGTFNTQLAISQDNSYSLLVQDVAGNQSEMIQVIESNDGTLPPDPATIAPALDPTQTTSLHDAIAFLYNGSNPIQTGVNPADIEAKRVAVIRGKVLNRDNTPLSGVTITIKDHIEFGQTLSRADGMFDMVINGGALLTINYQKNGYLPVQRKVKSPWRDYARADDVVMIQLDTQVTTIDLSSSQATQIAQGSVQTDVDGSRQATLMFSQGTSATMILPDGSSQTLTSLNVRATEYTVGENGPKAMPAPLPVTSGYTYAVELSVDEAITAGASMVEFNQPVNVYVDNFLNFPVGEIVPAGYYDQVKAAWIPSNNGKIIKIVSHTNGLANISIDPSGVLASQAELDSLAITTEEQIELAQTYAPSSEIWRIRVSHFTPWDFNWPYGPPPDAKGPEVDEPKTENEEQPDDPCEQGGCIIEAENQVLGERIPITGTPYSLNYRSSRTLGGKTSRTLTIPLSGNNLPTSLKAIDLHISVAGRRFSQRYPASTNQTIYWEWDGIDAFGRKVNTSQKVTIRIDYVYNVVYYAAPSAFFASFALPRGSRIIRQRNNYEVKLSKTYHKKMFIYSEKQSALGLWSISPHHMYDLGRKKLYKGNGNEKDTGILSSVILSTVKVEGVEHLGYPSALAISPEGDIFFSDPSTSKYGHVIRRIDKDGIVTTVAGNGTRYGGFSGDGGLAVDAQLNEPEGIAIGPDGELYIADQSNHRIRRIGTNGIITTVAGNGLSGFSGDGGLAVDASLNNPKGIVIGSEGELYITDPGNHRIRRVGTDGIITTIAGNGQQGFSGNGGLAVDATLNNPSVIAIDSEGKLYFAEWGSHRIIRRIGTDGIITTVAGGVSEYGDFTGDGGFAVDANLMSPQGIAIGPEDELYIADRWDSRIRRVGTDGIITTLAGDGTSVLSNDGGLAVDSGITPRGIAIGPEGELYVVDDQKNTIRRVISARPDFTSDDYTIPSKDGQQLFHFDLLGRHIRTLDTVTGVNLYTFTYTTSGLLDSITDRDGDFTQIQRDVNGIPLAIIAPDGQITTLGLNASGYLSNVTDPLGQSHIMAYDANGLMMSYSNPNNANSSYQYDTLGRLVQDVNSENGGWELSRSDFSNGYNVTMNSAENRSTLYQIETLSTGDRQRQITDPNGTIITQLTKTNGEEITSHPNGTIVSIKKGPDPRFGMMAPVVTNSTIQTPAGLLSTSSQINTAILIDNNDPLSASSLTETSTINGRISTRQYDANTKTWTDTSAANRISSVQINSKGLPVLSQVSGLESSRYGYDTRGRLSLITEGSGIDARNTHLNFYQNGPMEGYLQSIINPANQITSYEYDAVGKVTKQTLPDNSVISFSYDANGNLMSLTPPGRPAHLFQYDGLDQNIQYTPPTVSGIATPQTVYTYNKDKQLTQVTRPDGQQVSLNHGATSGKLDSMTLPRGSYSYSYNPSTGQLSSLIAPDNGVLNYSYDGLLTTDTQWAGEVTGQITRSYDNDFRITSRSINGVNTINYQYDNDSLLIQAGSLVIARDIQKSGLINGTTLGNLTTSRTYNGFAELVSFNASYSDDSLFETSYSRDKLGRISQKIETIGGVSTTTDYQYDLAGRLVLEATGMSITTYDYDANGNRTHINGTAISSYDEQDRIISYGSANYQFTANGELQSITEAGQTAQYLYDVLGNLTQTTLPDGTVIDYIIDGNDRRIGKRLNGVLEQGFLYKDRLNPIAELDGNNQVVARFIYASKANVPDTMIKNGNTYRIISDHLGSPRLVLDIATGSTVQRIDYDTWGNIINDSNPGFQPFGFAGGIYDPHTELTRFGARDYDARIGRWTVKDMIGFEGGDTNFYGYVLGDPINGIDLTGKNSLVQTLIQKIVQKIAESIGKSGHKGNVNEMTKEVIREHLAEKYEQSVQDGMDQNEAIMEYSDEMKRLMDYKEKGMFDIEFWEKLWDASMENWNDC